MTRWVLYVIPALIGLLMVWGGSEITDSYRRTPAEARAESARLLAEPYTPYCDGKAMGPGDVCVSSNPGFAGSYERRVADHRKGLAPEYLEWKDGWGRGGGAILRLAGYVVTGLGVLLALFLIGDDIAERRRAARRRRLAEQRGWTYAKRYTGDVPGALGPVVSGTYNGFPFTTYDVVAKFPQTVIALELPAALPTLVFSRDDLDDATDARGRALLQRKLPAAAVSRRLPDTYRVEGTTFTASAPRAADFTDRLDDVTALAAALVAAAEPGAPDAAEPYRWLTAAEKTARLAALLAQRQQER